MIKPRKNLTGQRIDGTTLTVVCQIEDYVKPDGRHEVRWLCQCDCGSEPFPVIGYNLTTGNTRHCRKCGLELTRQSQMKTNEYCFDREYGVGYAINTGTEFYFDWEDYNLIKDYCWYENINKGGYHSLETRDYKNGQKLIRMHYLLGCKGYDHKDRNALNNRKENLRPATVQENARNNTISKRNTSGIVGVSYYKPGNKWRAYINDDDGKFVSLGYYFDKEDAIVARLRAEKEYYGEFAPQQHLYKQYGVI